MLFRTGCVYGCKARVQHSTGQGADLELRQGVQHDRVFKSAVILLFATCPQGYGVYRFANKYGANVDGYSPIYTPDLWSETGDTYKLGTKGLIAW